MKYKFLEDVAIADIAFEAYGNNINELFENCALALTDCMVRLKQLKSNVNKIIDLTSDSLENLLYDFLSELVYIKDTEGFLFSQFSVLIKEDINFKLRAKCTGQVIDYKNLELRNDIKAITTHMFEIKKANNKYKATIVVDI